MGLPLARAKARRRVIVLVTAAVALSGLALSRSRAVEAHEVTTAYPVSCPMTGLSPSFTTTHTPAEGTTPGGTVTLHVKLATPAVNPSMPMPVGMVEFKLPKPALIDRIVGPPTFKTNGNFSGMSMGVDAAGTMSFMFMPRSGSSVGSSSIQLADFDITGVTKASAMAGERVLWMGPSEILLDSGNTERCTPTGGVIMFAPTVVLDPGTACTTTTEDPGHGDHGHGGHDMPMPGCPTTTTPTTPTTVTTPTTPTTVTTPTTPTTPTTVTTPTTPTTRPTVTTIGMPTTTAPPSGLIALIRRILCILFFFLC